MKDERELELGPEAPREAPDLVDTMIAPLWRSKYWIAGAALLGLCAGTFQAAIQPNTYESVGKLLARAGAREEGTAEARVSGALRDDSLSGREAVSNELHLVSNPRVYQNVVRRVGPARILAPYDPAAEGGDSDPMTRALHAFQGAWFGARAKRQTGAEHALDACDACVAVATRALEHAMFVRAEPSSSVLTITCSTSSAQLSADLVDAFIAEALLQHQAVFASDSSLAFLDEQVDAAMSSRASAQEALSNYRVECGFYDPEAQREHLLTDLNSQQEKLNEEKARLATLEALESVLASELAGQEEREKLPLERTLIVNPAHARLLERLSSLRLDLVAVAGRRDRTSRQVEAERASLENQIAVAQSELEQTNEFLDPGDAFQEQLNPRHGRLRERLDAAREELISLRSGFEQRQQRLAEAQRQLVELERCSPALALLETEARQTAQRLDQFLSARAQVGVMDLLDRVNLINLRPLQGATLALQKSGPRRGRTVLLGGMLGLVVGLAFAWVRPSLARGLRTPEAVERHVGTVVLGAVPEVPRGALATKNWRRTPIGARR